MSPPVWATDGRRAHDEQVKPPSLPPARSRDSSRDSSRDASCRRRHGTVGAGLPLRSRGSVLVVRVGNQSSVGYLAVCGYGHAVGCWLQGGCMIRGAPSTLCEAVVNYIAEHDRTYSTNADCRMPWLQLGARKPDDSCGLTQTFETRPRKTIRSTRPLSGGMRNTRLCHGEAQTIQQTRWIRSAHTRASVRADSTNPKHHPRTHPHGISNSANAKHAITHNPISLPANTAAATTLLARPVDDRRTGSPH
jgi:hypothetical protein